MEAQGLLAPVGGLCEGNGGMFSKGEYLFAFGGYKL